MTGVAGAQSHYPDKPIQLIVPYPPGAGADFTGRALAEAISHALGEPTVIDNRPGAGATVGHSIAAKAAPDGYTLLTATSGGMTYGPALGMKVSYDPLKDFTPIGLAVRVPYILTINGKLPPNTMREFIDYAKAHPGKLNLGSPGSGSPNHVGGVLLQKMTGIELEHVPYKGGNAMVIDLIAGRADVVFVSLPTVQAHAAAGRVKLIAVGSLKRISSAPDLPTIAETVPGFNNEGWRGLVGPRGIPQPIVQKLNAAINHGLTSPEVVKQFITSGLEPATSTPEELMQLITSELQTWRKVVHDANISVN
jgi:tripartite-type tricarboxylate transporter receptor subunit TctC